MNQQGMLLVLPVPFKRANGKLYIETQACNGLEKWADNFGTIIMAAPTLPANRDDKTMTWREAGSLERPERFTFEPLPWGYSSSLFFSNYRRVRRSLAALMPRARYLQFAISGRIGDWAAVAALEAKKQKRDFAIHTDRVESEVVRRVTQHMPAFTRLKARTYAFMMDKYAQYIIKNASLGLWNGQECYQAYQPFCRNSYLIHDVHTKPADNVAAQDVDNKIRAMADLPELRIVYAGRADPMKAPLDWIHAVEWARNQGVKLQATWMGDGPMFATMQEVIIRKGLQPYIHLTGFEPDRKAVFRKIAEADVLVFTHVTAESPRCLIEALVCGTPIVGYQSPYPAHLVKDFGGGMFVPMRDWKSLGNAMLHLFQNPARLAKLVQEAAENGRRFNDVALFKERTALLKKHLC